MKILLDTHFLYWIPLDHRRLTRTVKTLLAESSNQFLFSSASLLEISLKRQKQGSDFAFDPAVIRRYMLANRFEELPITGEHAVYIDLLPPIHKDPFDRLLIAQAVVEGIILLTADSTIARYPGPIKKV